ncbi:prohibitin family protein [bacterium]|nr:prohibitin family protein [bacterium]
MIKKLYRRMKEWFYQRRFRLIITLLLVLFVLFYLAPHMFIFVLPGQGGVLWKRFAGGTVIEKVYEEGTHIIAPWNKMYIYDLRTQQVQDIVPIISENGLTIHVELSIRYHPNRSIVGLLHKMVGPDYVNVVVVPEVEAVVRSTVGKYKPEEVYRAQEAIAEKIVEESAKQLEERYVKLDDVLIKRIRLPELISQAIENKLIQQQVAQEYDYRLETSVKEAKRKRIEAEGINNYNVIVEQNLNENILRWEGIRATRELAVSENAKVVVIGSGPDGLPIILGNQ